MTAPAKPTKKPARGIALLFLGALIVVPMVLLVQCGHTDGEIVVEGGPHGDFVIEPSDCHGLLRYGLHGAALYGARLDTGAAYLVADPTTRGREVQIDIAGSCDEEDATDCDTFFLREEDCTTFDIEIENTGVTVNDVRLVRGHASLECTLDDGTKVSGHVDFDGC